MNLKVTGVVLGVLNVLFVVASFVAYHNWKDIPQNPIQGVAYEWSGGDFFLKGHTHKDLKDTWGCDGCARLRALEAQQAVFPAVRKELDRIDSRLNEVTNADEE